MKPTARQVTLFKSAPREYANLSINPPVVAAYYIDEKFHTTWVIRSKTKFQDFDGKGGLEFTISDYKFLLPHVEAVFSSELVDCFGETGAAVDLILGQDFINIYSSLFYKRTNDVLQLSRSCINRTIWPEKSKNPLDLYTSSYLGTHRGGIAAYINICTPFNIWRPYRSSYWDPKEDIGLAAMVLAMRMATQMPISKTAPIIRLIACDKYTCERCVPFMETKYEDLEASKNFKNLKAPSEQNKVKLLLEYRKKYAERNNLNELSCVHVDVHGTAEFVRHAKDLATLGAEMSQLSFKNELPSQPIDGNYYHFDSHIDVFTTPRTETNKTIKGILQDYQEYYNTPGEETLTRPLKHYPKEQTATTTNAYLRNTPTHHRAPTKMTNRPSRKKTPAKKLPTIPPINLHPNNPGLEDESNNPLFSNIFTILDQVKAGKVTSIEKDAVLYKVNCELQEVALKEKDKALQTINRQRRNCDIIMAGAYQQHNESIEVVKKAARLQGYFEGFIDGKEMSRVIQNGTENPPQRVAHQASDDSIDLAQIELALAENVAKSSAETTAPERATDIAAADASQRLGNQRLAMEKSGLDGKTPNKSSIPNETISSTQCQLVKPARAGKALRVKADDSSPNAKQTPKDQDNQKNVPEGPKPMTDIKNDNLSGDSDMKTKSEPTAETYGEIKEQQYDPIEKKEQDEGQVDDYKKIPKPAPAPVTDLPVKHTLALHNRYSDIKAYSCALPVMHSGGALGLPNINTPKTHAVDPPKHTQSPDIDVDTNRSRTAAGIFTPETPTTGITPKQRAEMTNVSEDEVEEILERPIITLVQALEISQDLRETLSMLLHNHGAKVDVITNTDGGLRCVHAT